MILKSSILPLNMKKWNKTILSVFSAFLSNPKNFVSLLLSRAAYYCTQCHSGIPNPELIVKCHCKRKSAKKPIPDSGNLIFISVALMYWQTINGVIRHKSSAFLFTIPMSCYEKEIISDFLKKKMWVKFSWMRHLLSYKISSFIIGSCAEHIG